MKKVLLVLGVMAMSVTSVAKSDAEQLQDFIDIVEAIKGAIEKDKEKDRPEKPRKRRLVTKVYSIPVTRGEVLRGESVIKIRQALRRQGVNLEGKAIKSVSMRAKSKHGRAKVSLQVGRFDSREKRIDGNRRAFERRGRRTMHSVSLAAPLSVREQLARGGTQGRVRLNLRGNIKMGRVEVEVVSRKRRRRN